MSEVSVKDLLEAGCHFGHQTARWNPKMKPYIFAAKNGIHIIDLDKTLDTARTAYKFVADRTALGETVIFVGTKRQAADIIKEQAERAGQYYVNQRWLGGMLTNFKTIKASIDRLQTLYQRKEAGDFAKLTKKESLNLEREIEKLENSLGGIKTMTRLPGIVFIVDPKTEHIALHEAQRLKLPVIAITDTNCSPDGIDFVIPANDDAIKSINYLVTFIANACADGVTRREAALCEAAVKQAKEEKERPAADAQSGRVREKKVTTKARAYVAEGKVQDRKGGRKAGGTHGGTHGGGISKQDKKPEVKKQEAKKPEDIIKKVSEHLA